MEPMIEEMKKRFGDAVYTTEENVTLEESIRLLEEKKMTVTSESCTRKAFQQTMCRELPACTMKDILLMRMHRRKKILGVKHETLKPTGQSVNRQQRRWHLAQQRRQVRIRHLV